MTLQPNTIIYISNASVGNADAPNINVGLVKYFLLPHHPKVSYVSEKELTALYNNTDEKIIITTSGSQPKNGPGLRNFFDGEYYDFYSTENNF